LAIKPRIHGVWNIVNYTAGVQAWYKDKITKPTIQTNNVCRIYYGTVLTLLREYFIQIKCQNSAFSVSENENRVVWFK